MSTVTVDSAQPLYRDPTRTVEERVDDLLDRMTPEEKAAVAEVLAEMRASELETGPRPEVLLPLRDAGHDHTGC